MDDWKISVVNVVASTSLGRELDLVAIAESLDGATYNPKQFPGLVYRLKEPKTASLLFKSGNVVCTGSKDKESVKLAIDRVIEDLGKIGIDIDIEPEIEVQNMVASADLGLALNLNSIVITLGMENVEYEPEQFPGLVYRLNDPKTVVLIFGSGKLVCTGAKVPEDVKRSVDVIATELRKANMM